MFCCLGLHESQVPVADNVRNNTLSVIVGFCVQFFFLVDSCMHVSVILGFTRIAGFTIVCGDMEHLLVFTSFF